MPAAAPMTFAVAINIVPNLCCLDYKELYSSRAFSGSIWTEQVNALGGRGSQVEGIHLGRNEAEEGSKWIDFNSLNI